MKPTRRQFVKVLFAAGQTTLLGRLLGSHLEADDAPAEAPLNFLVFGDWGVNGAPGQTQVATQMARVAAERKSAFMLAVGDNFYQVGVADVNDPQWQSSFENVYTAKSLQIPCYVILGNHDYCGNCDAQIEYGKTHPRWIMPARYYTESHAIDAKTTVQFFFIDTCPFVREYQVPAHLPDNPTDEQRKDFQAIENLRLGSAGQDSAAQLAWLQDELAKSQAQWKLVVGHHPIYSGGVHGDQPELIEKILPLLTQHGVQVYLAGHDHDLQHLQSEGIDFLCSGAGGAKLYPLHATKETRFAQSVFGFMSFDLSAATLNVQLIDGKGSVVHAAALSRSA